MSFGDRHVLYAAGPTCLATWQLAVWHPGLNGALISYSVYRALQLTHMA